MVKQLNIASQASSPAITPISISLRELLSTSAECIHLEEVITYETVMTVLASWKQQGRDLSKTLGETLTQE